ncbi:winged helix-turn-helix transcriptional regulator [Vandammella animalimorsus]|uniref:Transcriptional regulator n=1 Tax=Vandammella animalimorsus TaxID=2029117 RepID=A0A2A2A5Y6_9BURK|nr:helix-turn-helix domain-containing protein [Vandammella animalimorsus]PAT33905.1 transcriptional regulator [Vandammella animalimorsus]
MIQIPCGQESGHCTLDTIEDSGVGYTLSLIGGKYKMVILYWLYREGVVRFNGLQRLIGGISYKTLSSTLKELERDGLIIRTEYPQIPPKVEYRLSDSGQSLIPILDAMCEWGNAQRGVKAKS